MDFGRWIGNAPHIPVVKSSQTKDLDVYAMEKPCFISIVLSYLIHANYIIYYTAFFGPSLKTERKLRQGYWKDTIKDSVTLRA